MHDSTRLAGAVAAALLSLAPLAAQTGDAAAVGDPVPDHEFSRLAGHDGRTRLSELYGRPVVLAGWMRRIPDGLHAAWLAEELHREFEDDGVVVVLQDRGRWSRTLGSVEDLDFWYRLFGSPLWITESVEGENDPSIVREASSVDVRSLVLIGVDGRLLAERRVDVDDEKAHARHKKELEKMLRDELKKLRKGWGEDRTAKRARGLAFGKDDLAGALKVLDAVKPDDVVPEHSVVRGEIERRFDALAKRVAFFLDEARFLDGERALDELADAVRGRDELEQRLAPYRARLESEDGEAALKLDKRLARILAPWNERELQDLDLDFIREVRAFAEEHGDSPVGARAARMDKLLSRVVMILCRIKANDFEDRVKDG